MIVGIYTCCPVFDGLWLHLWRYRLHIRAPAEHAVHSLRAVLFTVVVLLLLMGWSTSIVLRCGALVAVVDLVLVASDAAMETRTRDFQRGLAAGERSYTSLCLFRNCMSWC